MVNRGAASLANSDWWRIDRKRKRFGIRPKKATTDKEDAMSEDAAAAFAEFDIDGISAQDLKHWSQLAPEDQKLAEAEDLPVMNSTTPSKSLEQANEDRL